MLRIFIISALKLVALDLELSVLLTYLIQISVFTLSLVPRKINVKSLDTKSEEIF